VVSSRGIPDSTRFLNIDFIHAAFLYGSIEEVKLLSNKISSNMVYTNIAKKGKTYWCKVPNKKIVYNFH
jgi:hypothetical protein